MHDVSDVEIEDPIVQVPDSQDVSEVQLKLLLSPVLADLAPIVKGDRLEVCERCLTLLGCRDGKEVSALPPSLLECR